MMGASMIERVGQGDREAVVSEICDTLKGIVGREDGSQWLGYVRIRGVARRPE